MAHEWESVGSSRRKITLQDEFEEGHTMSDNTPLFNQFEISIPNIKLRFARP